MNAPQSEMTEQQWQEVLKIGEDVAKLNQKAIDKDVKKLCGAEITIEHEIERLSCLSAIEYEKERPSVAKKFNVRASVLDNEVKKRHKPGTSPDKAKSVVTSDKPYHGEVDGKALLNTIEMLIHQHIVLPTGAITAVTLWIACSYVYNAFRVFPKLAIISPEKRCGKTTLLDMLSGLCSRSLIASNISPSAIFRSIDLWHPTLIIDEADTFLSGRNDNIIGIINSGHTKNTAFVIRVDGDEHIPKRFSTWSPMAFASIKGIVGTVMDRSVIIPLSRKMVGDKVKRLSIDFKDDNELIRQQLVKWGNDNFKQLKANPVEPPEIQNDRAIDNWLPLFTVANVIGGQWPDKALSSYTLLNCMDEEETAAIMLLKDIKDIFESKNWVKVFSSDLVTELIKLEERPWFEWKKGHPMTANSLAKILKPFSIHSKLIRLEKPGRGYELKQFHDSFSRYIPVTKHQSVTTLQTNTDNAFSDFQSVTNHKNVTLQKQHKTNDDGLCNTVTLQDNLDMQP